MAPSATTTLVARASRRAAGEFDTRGVDIAGESTAGHTSYAGVDQWVT